MESTTGLDRKKRNSAETKITAELNTEEEGGVGRSVGRSLTDGVERVDGRVGDGDKRDAVGAHLHGDPDRPRRHGHGFRGA